jgi:hypothetical protein
MAAIGGLVLSFIAGGCDPAQAQSDQWCNEYAIRR